MWLHVDVETATDASVFSEHDNALTKYLQMSIIRLQDLLEFDQLSQLGAPDSVPIVR